MPELLKPESSQPQSHAQSLREDALRRLSRSPHPYHRRKIEIPHAAEKFSSPATSLNPDSTPPQTPAQITENEDRARGGGERWRDSANSDSGTEADDEHFLKGLPAPRLRPHKGLRGADGSLSSSPSPMPSPAILDDDTPRSLRFPRRSTLPTAEVNEGDVRKAREKVDRKRRVEIVRRCTEAGLLVLLGGVICGHYKVRAQLRFCAGELAVQFCVIVGLIAAYPRRLLRHINPLDPFKKPYLLAIPASFDPAPLLYPPAITSLVTLCLSFRSSMSLLPSLMLGIASLPRHLIPSTGGIQGSNLTHWFLSCLPLLYAHIVGQPLNVSYASNPNLQTEVLVMLPALHQALCTTLHYLTTTSLLEAELQLLSIALINLLILASSPQATILKALLWGGGVSLLFTCARVLKWGVALARVPKWRFRRGQNKQKSFSLGKFGASVFSGGAVCDSSEEEETFGPRDRKRTALRLDTRTVPGNGGDGIVSAIEAKKNGTFANGVPKNEFELSFNTYRRHTLPTLPFLPPKSSKITPSGRRKRAVSSSTQSFSALTQTQATFRKWMYAVYVYLCIALIILVGIREYVKTFALYGNEPIGWALAYLFGDIPWFRMQVVFGNWQRWISLPLRSGMEHEESCHLGWVEHLRHATFGAANTRLILSAYWLGIIIVGLLIVFRLSAVYEVDTRRKVFHFMMVAMLLPATFVDPSFAALALSLMLAIFLMLDLFRASQLPPLSKSLAYFLTPYVDGRDLKGPVVVSHIFLLIGCAIPLWLSLGSLPRTGTGPLLGWEVPTREVSMVAGVICVGMGDAAASLIGRRYGRHKWLWGGGKSIEGSVAFATAVALALVLAKAWLRIGGWKANNLDSWVLTAGKAGVAATMASLTEAVLTGGNDNVVVPVVLWLWCKGIDM